MSEINRAALFMGAGNPFELTELPIPEAREGGLTLRITRSNVCGSELHRYRGDGNRGGRDNHTAESLAQGIVIGHEATGVIHELGEGTTTDWAGQPLAVGDRLAFQYMANCGRCRNCTRGRAEACLTGWEHRRGGRLDEWPYVRGTFADYIYLHPRQAIYKVPDNVPDTVVASANCALSQVIMGIERVEIEMGDRVAIQGCGGLGLYACAIAKERGADMVIAIDAIPERLELARQMGADHVIDIGELGDPKQRIRRVKELTDGLGADVVVEVVGIPEVIDEGLKMLAVGGRYLEMGIPFYGTPIEIDPGRLTTKNQRFEAVGGYRPICLKQGVDFLSRRIDDLPLDDVLTDYPLERINDAFEDQLAGRIQRASLTMV